MTDESHQTDDALVEQARSGRREGFEGLYRRHGRRVYNISRRMLGDDGLAEDAVQDVFLQVYRSLGRFRGASDFATWLTRITYNTCLNRLRSAGVRRSASLDTVDPSGGPVSDAPDAAAVLGRRDVQEQIRRAMDRMDAEHRAILLLRVLEGKSYPEIAELTESTEAQVRGKLYRARKSFIQHFRP